MDGATLQKMHREAVGEPSGSQYLDVRTTYQYLWDGATEIVRLSKCLQATQTITTVAETSAYALNPDFLELALEDREGKFFIKYSDGTNTYFLNPVPYDEVVYANNTTSQSIPDRFAIVDKSSLYSQITGTATSAGAASAGASTLTDSSGLFTTTDYVYAGDTVHNTTQSDSGIVLSVTSATALVTAMFDNSTGASTGWSSSDAYVIQPVGRWQLVFDPPPSTAGHTATVYYVQRPAPVFHDYGMYRIPQHFLTPLVDYAAFRYKYRDAQPNFGEAFFSHWRQQVGSVSWGVKKAKGGGDLVMRLRANKWRG